MAIEDRMSTSDMGNESSDRIELLQGTLDMLILRTLLFGPAHGHQIAKHIQRTTENVLGGSLDMLGDLMPVRRAEEQRAEEQQTARQHHKRDMQIYRSIPGGNDQPHRSDSKR